jgi:hypothetical protein
MIRPRPGESFQHVSRANGGIAGATNHRLWGGYFSEWLAHGMTCVEQACEGALRAPTVRSRVMNRV